jgi:hypothetical protein
VEVIFDIISKPLAGLGVILNLLAGSQDHDQPPAIASLRLLTSAGTDSAYIRVAFTDGYTPAIRALLENAVPVVVRYECRYGKHTAQWIRRFQFDPVRDTACFAKETAGPCQEYFSADSLESRFSTATEPLFSAAEISKLRGTEVSLQVSAEADAREVGLKVQQLWDEPIRTVFLIP